MADYRELIAKQKQLIEWIAKTKQQLAMGEDHLAIVNKEIARNEAEYLAEREEHRTRTNEPL